MESDDLIGETVIDIEDRWYSSRWRSLNYIPIETRELFHPSSRIAQGKVRLWLEIIPNDILKNIPKDPAKDASKNALKNIPMDVLRKNERANEKYQIWNISPKPKMVH